MINKSVAFDAVLYSIGCHWMDGFYVTIFCDIYLQYDIKIFELPMMFWL